MITRLDTLLEAENDTNITEAQKIAALNAGYTKFYDFLIAADLSDFLKKTATFTTVAGTKDYALATIASDFYKLRNVYVNEGSNQYRPLTPVNEWYIQSYRPPAAAVSMRVDYIPCAPVLTTTGDSVDGVNGWEELIVVYAALDFRARRQEEPGWLQKREQELEARIKKMAYRDAGVPDRIIQRERFRNPFNVYNQDVNGYRVSGLNLELFYQEGYVVVT